MEVDIERAKTQLALAVKLPNDCPYKQDLIDHWTAELQCLMMQMLFSL